MKRAAAAILAGLAMLAAMAPVSELTADPIETAWECRCDTCCDFLDRVYGFQEVAEGTQE